jgi:hypothetical protein
VGPDRNQRRLNETEHTLIGEQNIAANTMQGWLPQYGPIVTNHAIEHLNWSLLNILKALSFCLASASLTSREHESDSDMGAPTRPHLAELFAAQQRLAPLLAR